LLPNRGSWPPLKNPPKYILEGFSNQSNEVVPYGLGLRLLTRTVFITLPAWSTMLTK
jgi:hypothetical protein